MALRAIGMANEVIVHGIHEPGLDEVLTKFHGAVDLSPLMGPNGSIAIAREAAATTTSPKETRWNYAVDQLFGDIDEVSNQVSGLSLGRYTLVKLGVGIPNPKYAEEPAVDHITGAKTGGRSFPTGASRFISIGYPATLLSLVSPPSPNGDSKHSYDKPPKLDPTQVSVVIGLREPNHDKWWRR